jgi:hypothetical protein
LNDLTWDIPGYSHIVSTESLTSWGELGGEALPLGLGGALRHASGGTCAEPVEVGQDQSPAIMGIDGYRFYRFHGDMTNNRVI